jgi:hypothetical protein
MPKISAKPIVEEVEPFDKFTNLVQEQIELLLKMPLDPKEKNAVIANAIKFIVVKNRTSGADDDGFFGSD